MTEQQLNGLRAELKEIAALERMGCPAAQSRRQARERDVMAVYDWMMGLPQDQRIVVRLRYLEGLTWDSVARLAGYSEKHVYKVRRRLFAKEKRA